MPTAFIANLAINLPVRFAEGGVLDDISAYFLNDIQHRRVKAKLRWLLQRGEINAVELQTKAIELCGQPLAPHSTLDDEDGEASDPILLEALAIARELITQRMARENMAPPKGLDDHARALVNSMPAIMEHARKRIEARYLAATSALPTV